MPGGFGESAANASADDDCPIAFTARVDASAIGRERGFRIQSEGVEMYPTQMSQGVSGERLLTPLFTLD